MPDFADLMMQRPATADRPLQGQTVLVVEDSRFACEALRLLCQRSGARIRRADTLRAAYRHLETYRPSIVMVDLGLPDGRGEDLIGELTRANPRIGAIIGMSGDDGGCDRALAAGADAFLPKPVASLSAFQSTLARTLPECKIVPMPRRDDPVSPDRLAVRDDLHRIASTLAAAPEDGTLDYVAQFLGGVAASSGDAELAEAAQDLAWHRAANLPTDRPRSALEVLICARLRALEESAVA